MKSINRREFLKGSIVAATVTALSGRKIIGANDKVIIGIMGVGGRGVQLIRHLMKRSDVNIKYICDADSRRYGRAAEIVVEEHGYKPKFVQDFREMLGDSEVDAIVNATSDRWHALGTIMACQAGKDVYTEKPLSLSIWDGRKMVEAARKYKRVVQVGIQTRSGPAIENAVEYIRSGKLGDVYLARVFNMMLHSPVKKTEVAPIPEGLDYELWCGPSPMLPYRPGSWWQGLWDFYCGAIPGDLAHQMDVVRYLIGKTYPDTVSHSGGVFHLKDGREQPDTQFATYEFGDLTLLSESALWTPYMHKIPGSIRDSDQFPNWPFTSTKVEICGTEAFMYFGRHGGGWQVYAAKKTSRGGGGWETGTQENELIASEYSRQGTDNNIENFISCIHSREKPKADVEEAHLSTLLCHLANISYRVGNRKLKFDVKTETFLDDEEANKYLKANYRKPWVIPDEV